MGSKTTGEFGALFKATIAFPLLMYDQCLHPTATANSLQSSSGVVIN